MNIDRLYTKELYRGEVLKTCKLCEASLSIDEHADDCPGRVLEGLVYEIKVEGANCTRGCCGYTNTAVTGSDLASIAEDAVRAGSDAVSPSFEARAVFEMGYPKSLIEAARRRIEAQRLEAEAKKRTQQETQERLAARAAAYAQLAVDKPDLSEEGYARRRAQLVELYGEETVDDGQREVD